MSARLRIQRWCICGDSLDVESSPIDGALALDKAFDELHTGDGHGPTDARGASNARRSQKSAERSAR